MSKQSEKLADERIERLTLYHVIGLTAGFAAGMIAGMWCLERTESVLLSIALGAVVVVVVFVIVFTVIVYLVLFILFGYLKLDDLLRGSHTEYFDDD